MLLVSQFAMAAADRVTFCDHGKPIQSINPAELQSRVTSETVRVFEPHDESQISFQALPLTAVLNRIYGEAWRKAEMVLFICADGYRDPILLKDLLKRPGWLAFKRQDSDNFTITEKQPKTRDIPLAPLFLIRAPLKNSSDITQDKEGWPYQIVSIDLIEFADQFPGLLPPKNAPRAAHQGYQHFRKYCVTCHALSGQGGKVGPELGSPVSVTQYYKEPWLKKWIANPSQIRTGTIMPAVVPADKQQARTIDEIVAYLKAMARK
jgi:cytochrome c2